MSEEEKKAIEQVKKLLENASPFTMSPYIYFSLEKVLNLIEKQDKMIDYMAGRIVELLEEKNITNHSKKDVIDIFKNLAVNNLLKEEKV